jgi:transglutaminase-like putative cysteine protease
VIFETPVPPPPPPRALGAQLSTFARVWRNQREQVLYLRTVVNAARAETEIRELARDIVFRQAGLAARQPLAHAIALARWVQTNITYVNELPEVFQTPLATLDTRYGDCDDQAVLLASLLESIGIPAYLVSIGWGAPPAPELEHIYVVADVAGPGETYLVPLDSTLRTDIRQRQRDPLAEVQARGYVPRVFMA